jgi:hypothetical protein
MDDYGLPKVLWGTTYGDKKTHFCHPKLFRGIKTAYLEAQKVADVALTVLQTRCLFLVRSPPSEDLAQHGGVAANNDQQRLEK